MKQDKAQQAVRDEKLVFTEDRVKIVKSNLIIDPTITQKEETYQVILDIIKNTPCYNAFLIYADVPVIKGPRVSNQEFTVPPSNDSLIDFLLELGYKGQLKHISKMFVDHMHQPWRTLGAIINICLSGKTSSNDSLRPSRIEILWGQRSKEDVRSCPIPGSLKPSYTTLFLNTNQFPRDKIGRGKGAQGNKAADIPKKATTASKKKRAKKIESSDEESEEQEERLVRKPRGFEIDTQKAIKTSKYESRFQNQSSGSSEGAGITPEVLDEPTGKYAVSDEGADDWGSTDDKTFLFDDKEENPEDIPWVSTDDDETENDNEEDDAS
ncbi:hypothetical protein Tco_0846320, partial [Tanacetum coccineum]